ncbi:MAG: hypothetical protein OEX81_05890 [Candidatus Pacebacteria bacterium]|nr:hypothetical protein [Candidatus Paceibacterota bacterium]
MSLITIRPVVEGKKQTLIIECSNGSYIITRKQRINKICKFFNRDMSMRFPVAAHDNDQLFKLVGNSTFYLTDSEELRQFN